MNVNRRDFLYHSGLIAAAVVGQTTPIAASASAASTDSGQPAHNSRGDFDFFIGHWTVSAKRLRHRLTGDQTWETVTGTTRVRPILHGAGNVDEDEFQLPGQIYIGGMLRLFDAKQNNWSTYGLDRDSGVLQPPQSGRFLAGRGEFYGNDEDGGRPIRVTRTGRTFRPSTTPCLLQRSSSRMPTKMPAAYGSMRDRTGDTDQCTARRRAVLQLFHAARIAAESLQKSS
jgi:hypothetical protein